MTGRLAIVGIGPGAAELVTPLATETLAAATDLWAMVPTSRACPNVPDRNVTPPTIARSWRAPVRPWPWPFWAGT